MKQEINYETFNLEKFIENHEGHKWMGGDLEHSLHSHILRMISKWGRRLSPEEINQLAYSVLIIPPKATSDNDFRDKLRIAVIKEVSDPSLHRMFQSLAQDEDKLTDKKREKQQKNIQYFEQLHQQIERKERASEYDKLILNEIICMVGDYSRIWADILSKRLEGCNYHEIALFVNEKYRKRYDHSNIRRNFQNAIDYIQHTIS